MNLFDVYPLNPIQISRASGSYVFDEKGQKYLDMYGGHAVISIGHTQERWVNRITAQLNEIAFYSNSVQIPLQQQLAQLLGEVSGKQDYQLFLCNSGAEANENALKLASFYNGRRKIIAFEKAFHGRTSLAVAATNNPAIVAPVNETENVLFLPYNDSKALEECFAAHGSDICAVIVEGIQGVGGIRVAEDLFLQTIRNLCDAHNAVYIADAVQCGYGRTGKFFSHDHAGVNADMYSMAKGMGNGFPIGGVMIHPKFKAKHGMLGTTFGGNHLACAAAIAVLEVIRDERLMENAREVGGYLRAELQKVEGLKQIRGKGLMIGFDVDESLGDLRKNLLFKQNIFTGEAKPRVIRLLPSLALTRVQANEFLEALRREVESLIQQAQVKEVKV